MGNLEKGMMPDQEAMPTPENNTGALDALRKALHEKLAKQEDDKNIAEKITE